MTHAEKLHVLRTRMKQIGVEAFMLPVADAFLSEYVPPHAMRLAWLTGFTGSAGMTVITSDKAVLFTDGRYTLQAEKQLDSKLYQVINSVDETPASWLATHVKNAAIGYDAMLHSARQITLMHQQLPHLIALAENPIDALWQDRPQAACTPAWLYEDAYAGQSAADKISGISRQLQTEGADVLLIAASENINWLLNIRGADVECTPIIQAYALLYADVEHPRLVVFTDIQKLPANVLARLPDTECKPLSALAHDIAALHDASLLLDSSLTPAAFAAQALHAGVAIIDKPDPIMAAKAVKNEVELGHMRSAHIKDGEALIEVLCWLDAQIAAGNMPDELTIDARLNASRASREGFLGLSFPAIVGAGAHGAIIHYRVTEASNRSIHDGELLLIDSGGQYLGGTTDITRTLAVGTPKPEYIEHYTRVLKGHIALARCVFPQGTKGSQLDVLARQYLWEIGMDYEHGTGHGVGACLSVHEGPQGISKRASSISLAKGMVLSNEPGVYIAGSHGIRIENLVEVIEKKIPGGSNMLAFRELTLVPYARALIDTGLLSAEEIQWLNAYHARVLASVSPALKPDTRDWLALQCKPL